MLGLFWVLDAALQFQPFMFRRDFIETFILPNASGQPAVVSWVITNIGHFIEPHIAVWNTFFALIQVVIGMGLLFRRTVRPALAVSFVWVLGVWVLGRRAGHGPDRDRQAALSGAPGFGSHLRPDRADGVADVSAPTTQRCGVDSSASAQGLGGRSRRSSSGRATGRWRRSCSSSPRTGPEVHLESDHGHGLGESDWFDHFLNSFGSGLSSVGNAGGWLLAIVSLIIGFGPCWLVARASSLAAGACCPSSCG